MINQMIPIGKLFDIEKGALQSTKCTPGAYDFITAAEDWKTHNEYSHECEALIFAAAASGSLGRTHYVDGKFTTSDLCYILTPKNETKYPLNLSFYHFVFNSLRPTLVTATKSGTSKESINQTNFKNYEIPYFDIELQDFWIGKLKSTLGLKDLLRSELTRQQSLIKRLRQQVLQESIEGKLTADWRARNPDAEPASEPLKRITAEKVQLVKDKKIKAQKPLPPITDEEKPFDLPQGWEWMKVEHFLQHDRRGMITGPFGSALQKSEHQAAGVPVWGIESIKNGQFTYKNKIFVTERKAIELKSFVAAPGDLIISRSGTIDEVCVIPMDVESGLISTNLLRVSILVQIINPQYFCFLFKGCASVLEQLKELCSGSTRLFLNQNILKSLLFPVPPISEQQAIVTKVEKLLAICDQLETQITQNQAHAEQLMQAVLKEAFSHNSEAETASATPKAAANA